MANFQKYTKIQAGKLCAHNDRTASNIGNDKIISENTKNNYNLGPLRDISQTDFINQRCNEIKCLKRDDVNVMCSWLVTVPKDLPAEDTNTFFQESYNFLTKKYGEKNVISAYVHRDESQPHMHFAFVPVVEDKKKGIEKVSAKECVTRNDLQKFHAQLDERMTAVFGRDIGVLNDATKDGNKSIEELKQGTAIEELDKISNKTRELNRRAFKLDGAVKELGNKKDSLEGEISALNDKINMLEGEVKGKILSVENLNGIKPQKTAFGNLSNITIEDVENLKATAYRYNEAKADLQAERKAHAKTKKKVPSIDARKKQSETILRLEKAEKMLDMVPKDLRAEIETLVNKMAKNKTRGQWQPFHPQ